MQQRLYSNKFGLSFATMAALQGYCDEPLHLETLFNLEKEINQVASASREMPPR